VKAILIVDDEFGIVDSLAEMLSEEGFAVSTASNGKDALRRIAERRPDLILMDYMMPVMDGAETLQTIRSDLALRDIPVVLMSSVPKANLPAQCVPTGFLRKPFDVDALLSMLASLLAG
jgi:CheY-like chemotaxis protein